jgi:mycofactocin precursor
VDREALQRAEWSQGGDVSIEILVPEDDVSDESEELLVEEISIDGLCGVY